MADEKINEGDSVQLRSGSPLMTVTELFSEDGKEFARCTWFAQKGQQHGVFPVSGLVKSKPGGISAMVIG